jgi:sensor histidine kinase regulating citrate/malate metabolism
MLSMDNQKIIDMMAVKTQQEVDTLRSEISSPQVRSFLMSKGIMFAEIHDVVKVKPFECQKK